MEQYHSLLSHIKDNGVAVDDRTGTGTISVFGYQTRFSLADGFPAVTTKKLQWKAVVAELLWFIRGSTNVEELRELTWGAGSTKRTIWDDNYDNQAKTLGYTDGNLGPVYGAQWRDFGGVDQLRNAIATIIMDPSSRRNIVSAWNVPEIPKMALPPCHTLFQFYCVNGQLSLQLYQRSCDVFLGGPFNIASYSLLLAIVARLTKTVPHEFVWTIGDAHIYKNHVDQVNIQLSREGFDLPQLWIDPAIQTFEDVLLSTPDQYQLQGYMCHSAIPAPMAI